MQADFQIEKIVGGRAMKSGAYGRNKNGKIVNLNRSRASKLAYKRNPEIQRALKRGQAALRSMRRSRR